jgi:hypothetical protein
LIHHQAHQELLDLIRLVSLVFLVVEKRPHAAARSAEGWSAVVPPARTVLMGMLAGPVLRVLYHCAVIQTRVPGGSVGSKSSRTRLRVTVP